MQLLFSCAKLLHSYDYVVNSDYNYDGTFDQYKSFASVKNNSFAGTAEEKETIEKHRIMNEPMLRAFDPS